MPGAPLGPAYRTTMTEPGFTNHLFRASRAFSWEGKQKAGPECSGMVLFSIRARDPMGARFPLRTAIPPVLEIGFFLVRMTGFAPLRDNPLNSRIISPILLPVTFIALKSN